MEKLLKELIAKVAVLIKIQVLVGMRDMNQSEKIFALYDVGIGQKEIAEILGAPPNSVTSVVSKRAKKAKHTKSIAKEDS
jgi:transcriptional regulator